MICLIKKLYFYCVVLAVIFVTPITQAAIATIDVLVVYTKGTTDLYGSDPTTRFNQIFQVTNQIYKDSNVDVEIRLVGSKLVDYTDDNDASVALNDITYAKVTAFSDVAAYRDQVKADMVIFYRPYKSSHGSCGIAWIGGSANGNFSNPEWKKYMYAHVAITSCGDYVTAHELGHNMGLKHSRKQDGSGGSFPYALGHGVDNQFTTIMAYQTSFNVDYWSGKLYKFSNPDLLCKGLPCGVDRNNAATGADAHYALNITAPQIAKFNIGASVSSSNSSIAASSVKSSVAASSKSLSSKPLSSKAMSSKPASSKAMSSKAASLTPKSVMASSKAASKPASSKPASSKPAVSKPASSKPASSAPVASKPASSKSASSSAAVMFTKVENVAQYGGADWRNEVSRSKGLTVDQAKAIAVANPNIKYFFIVKGSQLYINGSVKRIFMRGDVVFFSGSPWYGTASGLADGYEKNKP